MNIVYVCVYAIFCFASAADMVDLSGKEAATASIFLNCHGNLEGYKNGRRSNPCYRLVSDTSHKARKKTRTIVVWTVLLLRELSVLAPGSIHGTHSVV